MGGPTAVGAEAADGAGHAARGAGGGGRGLAGARHTCGARDAGQVDGVAADRSDLTAAAALLARRPIAGRQGHAGGVVVLAADCAVGAVPAAGPGSARRVEALLGGASGSRAPEVGDGAGGGRAGVVCVEDAVPVGVDGGVDDTLADVAASANLLTLPVGAAQLGVLAVGHAVRHVARIRAGLADTAGEARRGAGRGGVAALRHTLGAQRVVVTHRARPAGAITAEVDGAPAADQKAGQAGRRALAVAGVGGRLARAEQADRIEGASLAAINLRLALGGDAVRLPVGAARVHSTVAVGALSGAAGVLGLSHDASHRLPGGASALLLGLRGGVPASDETDGDKGRHHARLDLAHVLLQKCDHLMPTHCGLTLSDCSLQGSENRFRQLTDSCNDGGACFIFSKGLVVKNTGNWPDHLLPSLSY